METQIRIFESCFAIKKKRLSLVSGDKTIFSYIPDLLRMSSMKPFFVCV